MFDNKKSIFGHVFLLFEGAISWKCAEQSILALSTAEEEFVPWFEATIHALLWWMQDFISGLGVVNSITRTLKIYCSNSVTIFLLERKYSKSDKHIKLKIIFHKGLVWETKNFCWAYQYCSLDNWLFNWRFTTEIVWHVLKMGGSWLIDVCHWHLKLSNVFIN